MVFEERRGRHTRAPTSIAGHSGIARPVRAIRPGDRHAVAAGAIHVHDGDTFYIGPDAFRLRGIDTPELGQPRAEAARDRLRALLHSGPVTIVRRAEDVYGRIVVDVFVSGRSVARVLKAEGFAKPRAKRGPRARRSLYRSLDILTSRCAP
jgi:endonuclease YncB( thermonuclease family)